MAIALIVIDGADETTLAIYLGTVRKKGKKMLSTLPKDRKIRISLVAATALLIIGTGIRTGEALFGGTPLDLFHNVAVPEAQSATTQRLPEFTDLVTRLRPAVVNISTTQEITAGQLFPGPFGPGDPFNDFWRRFFGSQFRGGRLRQQSLGSGFIIDPDGLILTNSHVVDNAQKIVVKLSDEREFEAKVVGKDPKTDIALLSIHAKETLPVAPLGDSDRLQVGEWVLAIGNPFGLESTVTAGIVSGKGRHIGAGPYDNFIQTDASINPGNSGGPLINLRGEVVGINTAIFSRTGANVGIGFATPINLAKEILPELKSKGKVTRGWLGVSIQGVTPALAESLGLDKPRGALVADVSKDGPADRAGIKVGDVIVAFDGKEISEASDLPILVARSAPEKQVGVTVLRDKKEIPLTVTVRELQEEQSVASIEKGKLGLTVQQVTPRLAESLGLSHVEGVVVTSVESGSPAEDAGLQRGDVILEINRNPIRNLSDYRTAITGVQNAKNLLFLVRRGDNTMFLALQPLA
ncbi:MAG TPA: DegQ family serine endoprotease [Methylomirabilota bacterium]|nr:DegQ family serine endoprotease [Methylomirabilota bacterium]